ncbi:MAG TPA: hypothetical protein PKC28_05590 [Bdellovibrionales bacterium]|nr:hypothetical protein [Bdellovibrionales bacterium]
MERVHNVLKRFANDTGFDQSKFKDLVEDTNPDTAIAILKEFNKTLGATIETLNAEPSDKDGVGKACHKVAGSAALVGFLGIESLARANKRGDQEITGLVARLKAAHQALTEIL